MAELQLDFSSALRQRDQELLTLHQGQIDELQAQVGGPTPVYSVAGLWAQVSYWPLPTAPIVLQVKKQLLRANGLADDLVQADRSRSEASQDCRRLQQEAAHAQQTADGLRAQLQQARALLQASHDELTAGMDRGICP